MSEKIKEINKVDEKENSDKVVDIVSFERFVNILYQDYIVAPIIQQRGEITPNRLENHQRILDTWRETNPAKYQKGLEALVAFQSLSKDMGAVKQFEERKKEGIPLLANLIRYQNRDSEYNFEHLEDERLISSKGALEPVNAAMLKIKYGDKIVIVEGKAEYYLEESNGKSVELENDLGEELVITPKGRLSFRNIFDTSMEIQAYEIIKQEGDTKITTIVFSEFTIGDLYDDEKRDLIANYLLDYSNLLGRNYGGYIGSIEKTSLVSKENSMPIHRPQEGLEDSGSYSITYDPEILTAACLYTKQLAKDLEKKNSPKREMPRQFSDDVAER